MSQYLNETFSSGSFLVGKSADVGGAWSNPANNWGTADPAISGGRCLFDTTSPYSYVNSAAPGDSVQDITVEWTPAADNWFIGAIARYQVSGGSQLLCRMSSGGFSIVKLSSATDWPGTTLATATASIAAGDRTSHTLRFKVDAAGAMSVWLDGSPVTMTGTTTDNTLTASGSKSGFWGRGGSSTQITADDGASAAATLSSPIANATGPTQATIGVTTDTPPTSTAISYQILPAATGAPSAATIVGAPDGTITTGSAGALTKAITGLTTNTAVKVHFAQGTTSNVVSSASFTPSTLASSGSPAAQTGTAGAAFTWAGATPDSFITNHGNGSGSWFIVSSAGFTVAPSINTTTGVLSGGTLSSPGTYAPQIRYTDSSTVPSAQTVTFTLGLTVSSGGGGTVYGFKLSTTAGLQFGNIVGALTGLGLSPAGEQWVATVHSAADHSTIVAQSGALTMLSGGRLPDFSHASIANATSYFVSFRRVTDGATCSALLTSEAVP